MARPESPGTLQGLSGAAIEPRVCWVEPRRVGGQGHACSDCICHSGDFLPRPQQSLLDQVGLVPAPCWRQEEAKPGGPIRPELTTQGEAPPPGPSRKPAPKTHTIHRAGSQEAFDTAYEPVILFFILFKILFIDLFKRQNDQERGKERDRVRDGSYPTCPQ